MSQDGRARLTMAALVTVVALSEGRPEAQSNAPNSQPNPYQAPIEVTLPEGRKWGSTNAVETDRDGTSIWFFERCGAGTCAGSNVAPIVKLDSTGKLVRSFGAGMGFVFPHGLHQDREGNIWVSDGQANKARTTGLQVFKFSPEGKLLLTLGKAGVAGEGPDTFVAPSDVVTASNGDIFVADGHGDIVGGIVKFSKDGRFIKRWGRKGSAPSEFGEPHALAMDSRGRLFVADRSNSRIQIFDQEGKFLEEWKQFGRPAGLFIDRNDTLYATDHQSNEKVNVPFKQGIRIGSAKTGQVMAFVPDLDPRGTQEGVAADVNGTIYGTLTGGKAVKKYLRK